MKQSLEKYWPGMTLAVDRRISGEEKPVPTPWPQLNKLLGGGFWAGLHPIISSPGNGKTTFAAQIAAYAALSGCETYYASLELDETQIVLRLASAIHGKLSWNSLLRGNEAGRAELDEMFWTQIKGLPLVLDTGSAEGWQVEEIERWLAVSDKTKTRLCVIDYLQLAHSSQGEDTSSRVSYLTRRLQDIARLNNVAIVAISSTARSNYDERQLFENAEVEGRQRGNVGTLGNRSVVTKLAKESGDVEYGATTLSALVRAGARTYLLIAKRRLDDGGVWCSFVFRDCGFHEDDTFGPYEAPAPAANRQAPPREDAVEQAVEALRSPPGPYYERT